MSAVAAAVTTPLFDPARLDRADTVVRSVPFHFLVAREQLPAAAAAGLQRDFPAYPSAGFFPYEPKDCGPEINRLIGELTEPAVGVLVGHQFR